MREQYDRTIELEARAAQQADALPHLTAVAFANDKNVGRGVEPDPTWFDFACRRLGQFRDQTLEKPQVVDPPW